MFYSWFVNKSWIFFLAHCLPWCLCIGVCSWEQQSRRREGRAESEQFSLLSSAMVLKGSWGKGCERSLALDVPISQRFVSKTIFFTNFALCFLCRGQSSCVTPADIPCICLNSSSYLNSQPSSEQNQFLFLNKWELGAIKPGLLFKGLT